MSTHPLRRLATPLLPLALLGAVSLGWPMAAPAPAAWDWARHCFKAADLDVLHPIIQQLLKQAAVGTRQPWCSTTGREGYVYLLAGGERAGATTATVRITTVDHGKERVQFVFRYRKDPARGWGIVG